MFAPTKCWLAAFTDAVSVVMRRCGCPLNSCVEAGCIGVGVARTFGYVPAPVPVAVLVQAGREATVLPGPERRWPPRPGFEGHLVLHFPGDVLVDLTAAQFHAPARGLYVPDTIVVPGLRRELLAGGVEFDLTAGTTMRYQELVGNVAWQSLPAWVGSSDLTIRLVVAEMHRRLDTRRRKSRVSRARDR